MRIQHTMGGKSPVITFLSTGLRFGSVEVILLTFALSIFFTVPAASQQTFIYVSDAGNFDKGPWKILQYDEKGESPLEYITDGLAWPQDILFIEEKNEVWISNLSSGNINRYNAETGELIGLFANVSGGPTRIKIGKDNLLYVLQWSGNGKVLRYSLEGSFIDEFTDVGVYRSIGMDWDAENNLYVSSYENALIRKFDENGKDMGLFIQSNLKGPTDIWFDDDGNLVVNDWSGDCVVRFDANGNFIDNFINSGLSQPEGVDFYEDGRFMIGSGGTSEVQMYAADGTLLGNLVSKGNGGLVQPNAVRIRVME